MENIFMSTKNSKTTESNRFRLYFTNILDLRGNKAMSLANFSIYYNWQNIKDEYKTTNLRSLLQLGMKLLIYHKGHLQ